MRLIDSCPPLARDLVDLVNDFLCARRTYVSLVITCGDVSLLHDVVGEDY